MEYFEIGDIVELKLGSPKMTVTAIDFPRDGEIRCEWFTEGIKKIDSFHPSLLVKDSNELNK